MFFLVKVSTVLTDYLLLPFRSLPPFWGLLWLSLITSAIVLLVYRWISFPAQVRRAKDAIKAHILAIRIYRDHPGVIVRSFFAAMGNVLRYFALNLLPLLVLFPILFFLFVQMEWRYGARPFRPGETAVVKVKAQGDVELLPSDFYKKELKVRVKALEEVDFRVKPLREGIGKLLFQCQGERLEKRLVCGDIFTYVVEKKFSKPGWEALLYPWEEPMASSCAQWISVDYPSQLVSFLGIRAHWLLWYLLLILVFVLPVHKKFGIEF